MALEIDGSGLTIDKLLAVARGGEKVRLSGDALERIGRCRRMVEEKVESGEVMYGVNTGIGDLADVALSREDTLKFQKYLICNHAAGIGEPLPVEQVRGAMLSKINVHACGRSGCRPVITNTLVEMLNAGLTPVVASRGSVGACGDLAPMSQIMLLLLGKGEAYYEGKRMPGAGAMDAAGISPPGLEVRDGLASINGANFITAISALHLYDIRSWIRQAEIAAAIAFEALLANLDPLDERIHDVRGFPGAIASAAAMRRIIAGSELANGNIELRVQDAYSLRSTPQIIGALRDAVDFAERQIETELNGVGDNPIFFPEDNRTLTGANFQGTPVSLPMDMVGAALTMVCVLSERRLNRLMNPALSRGLPPFLTGNPGLFSGLMLSQYTADSLIAEQRILSSPASIQSIPAAADQEDFVSMGMTTALKNERILENARGVLGIEIMSASHALDFRDHQFGAGVEAARRAVRETLPAPDEERPLHRDHDAMRNMVASGKILEAVEAEVGELE